MSDEFSLQDSWHRITVTLALLTRVWTALKYHLDFCSPVWVIFVNYFIILSVTESYSVKWQDV
jgi:hypothetical protein